ncbi:MAG: cell filamentation protein Fic, partial [candidate division SR1 bacterium]
MQHKISIRFYNDQEIRALWDEKNAQWRFSVIDIISILNQES